MASKKVQRAKDKKAGKHSRGKGDRIKHGSSNIHARERISSSMILTKLQNYILDDDDKINMVPQKVTAALGLLKKVIPDLQAVHSTQDTQKTHEEWLAELSRETDAAEMDDES